MEDITQKIIDKILKKIEDDYESVSVDEVRQLILAINSRYNTYDPVVSSLSFKQLKRNIDSFSRAAFGLVENKTSWKNDPKHYILKNLGGSCFGLTSETRKELFVKNGLSIYDTIDFRDRWGFAKFKFFTVDDKQYLFLVHDYGDASITNSVEEIVVRIQDEYLEDIGFNVSNDNIPIYYKDDDFYFQVSLNSNLENPSWRDITEDEERKWFDYNWKQELSNARNQETSKADFFESGKPYDAYKKIRDILTETKKKLFIIDPYIDSQLFSMLENVKPTVNIMVLASKLHGDSDVLALKFKKQRGNFELRKTKGFHDRFIFSDDRCYLIGSSLNNIGDRASLIMKLNEEAIIQTIKAFAETLWKEASE